MIREIINREFLIKNFPNENDYIKSFFNYQISKWEFAKNSYKELNNSSLKKFQFDKTTVFVQYNPGREKSTFADTSEEAIKNRKCYLCDENLFDEQIGLKISDKFTLLVNPYPIVKKHFTAKFHIHVPQRISENFSDFLQVSDFIGENYFLLFNGPEAGASVPEHRHFQAGDISELPLVNEIKDFLNHGNSNSIELVENKEIDGISVLLISDKLRSFFLLKGRDNQNYISVFYSIYQKLQEQFPSKKETKLNLLAFKFLGQTIVLIFPRRKHRPDLFYDTVNPVKISPATIDIAGILVAPRYKDFEGINKKIIKQIFDETLYNKSDLRNLL